MKKLGIPLLLVAALFACDSGSQSSSSTVDTMTTYDDKVEEVLSSMTLKEKVGQMTQVTLGAVAKTNGADISLDSAKLREYIVEYGVGSFLNCAGQARTRAQWQSMIGTMQTLAMEESRVNIPILYGIDAIHGTNYTADATLFPQQVGLAATWNPALVEQAAAMAAYETRASSIPWTFSPVLDLGVDPRWPRQWEGFGEDPLLQAKMGVAMTAGFQGDAVSADDRVAACLKHFIGYGAPLSGKDRTPTWIPEIMLREMFMPPFQAAIDAGAKSIMINSGEVNGVPVHASKFLLTDILRTEMGFEGVAVTDWYDIRNLVERHHVAADNKEAVRLAILAGVDMSMVPYDVEFADNLLALVEEGIISEARIDQSVRRILQLKVDLGLWDKPISDPAAYPNFASEVHREIARQAARESLTLLKNAENTLPLPANAKVLVTGPNANSMRSLNGGWTYTWQGERTDAFVENELTILEALQAKLGAANVEYEAGVSYVESGKYWEDELGNLSKVRRMARKADYVILCLGENSYTEKPGDLNDLTLSENQVALANEVIASGTPVILVLNEGRPRIITDIVPDMAAVVQLYLPGNHGGEALAEVLTGEYNPSGKLPYTYPRFVHDIVPYYHKHSENIPHNDGNVYTDPFFNPLYEFGHGLSYTSFAYSGLKVNPDPLTETSQITVSVTVENTGEVAGTEVVQLFVSDVVASVTPSVKRLRAFEKVSLAAGESKTVTFTLNAADLAFIGQDLQPVVEPGEFIFRIADQETSVMLQ